MYIIYIKRDVGSKTIYEGACSCRNCLTFPEAKSKSLSLPPLSTSATKKPIDVLITMRILKFD